MIASQGSIQVSEFGIVRVETDEGLTGWGEIAMSWGRLTEPGLNVSQGLRIRFSAEVLGGQRP